MTIQSYFNTLLSSYIPNYDVEMILSESDSGSYTGTRESYNPRVPNQRLEENTTIYQTSKAVVNNLNCLLPEKYKLAKITVAKDATVFVITSEYQKFLPDTAREKLIEELKVALSLDHLTGYTISDIQFAIQDNIDESITKSEITVHSLRLTPIQDDIKTRQENIITPDFIDTHDNYYTFNIVNDSQTKNGIELTFELLYPSIDNVENLEQLKTLVCTWFPVPNIQNTIFRNKNLQLTFNERGVDAEVTTAYQFF